MKQYTVAEARKNIALLMQQASKGETVIITRKGKPCIRMIAEPSEPFPPFGFGKDQITIADDFDTFIPEGFEEYL